MGNEFSYTPSLSLDHLTLHCLTYPRLEKGNSIPSMCCILLRKITSRHTRSAQPVFKLLEAKCGSIGSKVNYHFFPIYFLLFGSGAALPFPPPTFHGVVLSFYLSSVSSKICQAARSIVCRVRFSSSINFTEETL